MWHKPTLLYCDALIHVEAINKVQYMCDMNRMDAMASNEELALVSFKFYLLDFKKSRNTRKSVDIYQDEASPNHYT